MVEISKDVVTIIHNDSFLLRFDTQSYCESQLNTRFRGDEGFTVNWFSKQNEPVEEERKERSSSDLQGVMTDGRQFTVRR